MLKRAILAGLVALISASSAFAQVYVRPYTRSDGTTVQGHYRTPPNNTLLDNYSTRGNVNPYTGKPGVVNPYKVPSTSYGAPPRSVKPPPPPSNPYRPTNPY
jgi:hypothetical protein